jgi:starch phosphorylase
MRPLEACGTSGMKSALNGGLNLSIRDGWWDEFHDGSNGWAIPTADGVHDPVRRDDLEAAALYELMGSQVAPLFYDRDADGVPTRWLAMVRHTLDTLGPRVQASRMVGEYVDLHYAPAATAGALAEAEDFHMARDLADYRRRLSGAWSYVRVTGCELGMDDGHTPVIGDPVTVHAAVDLAGLTPSDVEVQAVIGRVGDTDELTDVVTVSMRPAEPGRYVAEMALPHAGALGVTVRVLPKHNLLATPAELGKVVLA